MKDKIAVFIGRHKSSQYFRYQKKVLDLILLDFDKIESMDSVKQGEIIKVILSLDSITRGGSGMSEKEDLQKIDSLLEKIISVFGKESFYSYIFSCNSIVYRIHKIRDYDFYSEINLIIDKYEGILGRGNPELNSCILLHCLESEFKCDWNKCIKFAEIACQNEANAKYAGFNSLASMSFIIKAKSKQGRFGESLEVYKKLPDYTVESINEAVLRPQFRIFSSISVVYKNLNKPILSLANQELALVAISKLYEKKHPLVQEQAVILRDLLANNKEFSSMRNLEGRYMLTPLPKQMEER